MLEYEKNPAGRNGQGMRWILRRTKFSTTIKTGESVIRKSCCTVNRDDVDWIILIK